MSMLSPANSYLSSILSVVGDVSAISPISLHEPSFTNTDAWINVKDCLDTGWVSSGGKWVEKFENDLCRFTGAKYAIAVSNGTVALRLALHLVGVENNDEVLIPPLSFVATANAVAHLGAHPHFIDVNADNLGMSATSLEQRLEEIGVRTDKGVVNRLTGRRIAAVLPVHVFGFPADIESLRSVCVQWGLPLVEDAAESLGSTYKKKHCGLFGDLGIFSFNGNKIITAGGGGALVTNSMELATKAKHLSTTAKVPHRWNFFHDQVGWNDRMPNINAALVVSQLDDITHRLDLKKKLHSLYSKAFLDEDGASILQPLRHVCCNYWLVTLRLNDPNLMEANTLREELLTLAFQRGLMLRPIWHPLHLLPMFSDCQQGCLAVAENEAKRLVNLPSSPQLIGN